MRQRARTGLTLSAIIFCAAVILLMMAFTRGGHQQMIRSAVTVLSGHFQIQGKGYLDDPSLDKGFVLPEELMAKLDSDERVAGVAPRVIAYGLLATDNQTAGSMVIGLDPARELKATTLARKVRVGRFLEPDDKKSIVIGTTLAKNMEVEIGDEIQLMVLSYYGGMELSFYKVVGMVKTGIQEVDQALVLMPLADLQYLVEMEDMVTEVAVVLKSSRDRKAVLAGAHAVLKSSRESKVVLAGTHIIIDDTDEIVLVNWEDIMPQLYQFVLLDDAGAVLYLLVLVIVVGIIVLLTISMSVLERMKEFGVLLAIGAKPARIFWKVIIESAILGSIGTVFGLMLGSIPSYYWLVHPIDFSASYGALAEQFGIEPIITTEIMFAMYPGTALIMMVLVVGMAVIPAVRASRIKPVDALRHA